MKRRISDAGIKMIKAFEGCSLTAYPCIAGKLTIGYGATRGVRPGDKITQAEAETLLLADLEDFEEGVERLVTVPLNQNQFDALVSFAFNLGLGALESSTLLRRLNAGNYEAAAMEFLRWNRANGRIVHGLAKRRNKESLLFSTKVTGKV